MPRMRWALPAAVLAAAVATLPAEGASSQEPIVRVQGGEVQEGDSGVVDSFFDVFLALDARVPFVVTVSYRTVDGTATAGSDYQATEGTLVFQPGETQKRVRVGVIGDTVAELDETFSLQLSNLQPGGRIEVPLAPMNIRDDDPVLCRCVQVRAGLGKGKFFAKDTGPQVYFTYRFPVRWAITCSNGDVVACRGQVAVSTRTEDVQLRDARGKPAQGKVIGCRGERCDATTIGSEEIQVRVQGSKRRKGLFPKKEGTLPEEEGGQGAPRPALPPRRGGPAHDRDDRLQRVRLQRARQRPRRQRGAGRIARRPAVAAGGRSRGAGKPGRSVETWADSSGCAGTGRSSWRCA